MKAYASSPAMTTAANAPLRAEDVTMYHARALARARRISWDDAFLTAHFYNWPPSAGLQDRSRERIASVWNEALQAERIGSILSERSSDLGTIAPFWQAIVSIHGAPPRDVHATAWHSDLWRAARLAEAWADRNEIVVADVLLEPSDPFDREQCLRLLAQVANLEIPQEGDAGYESRLALQLRSALAEIDRLSAPWWR